MKQQLFLDVECYPNYFLALFRTADGKSKAFEAYDGQPLDTAGLERYLTHPSFEIVTFNGNGYDIPILTYALDTPGPASLFRRTEDIIVNDIKPWNFYKMFGIQPPSVDHIDLIEVAPGKASLKIYGGRMHTSRLQDLPFPPGTVLTPEQMPVVKSYCYNDLAVTIELANALRGQIDLRRTMSKEYGVDLRSKSDAQIAEAVLKAETQKITGHEVKKLSISYDPFYYQPPEYIRFITPYMKEKLAIIKASLMVVKPTGHVEMPEAIDKMDIEIAGKKYKVGIGGLHSQESEVSHYADENTLLVDRDVVSYYPNLMLNMGMVPEAIGDHFLTVYRNILNERVEAKRAKNKVKDASLKITLNGTFGKTSNRYSILYNPEMMIRTTLTGQLSLLMLIELLEHRGIPVVSANTDGIVIKCPVEKRDLMLKCVAVWERATNLETEETQYKALHSRDVNNYIAVKLDGSVKTKGVYASSTLMKSPQNEICSEAVCKFLVDGTPIEDTVRNCTDIRKFISLRTVQGGAHKEGYALGKAIRWYYAKGELGVITYRNNGNTVPRSEGAKPIMDLPDTLPSDVDYDWYIKECNDILMDIGVVPRPVLPKIPRKNSKAWKALEEAGSIFVDSKGKSHWIEIPSEYLPESI